MEAAQILDRFRQAVISQGAVVVSLSIPRPWTGTTVCSFEGETLLLSVPDSFPALTPDKRLRISFSAVCGKNGPEIRGNGIGHFVKAAATVVRLVPYRIFFTAPSNEEKARTVIELRKNSWVLRQPDALRIQGIGFWFRAVRAVSFPLSVFPVLIGTICALPTGPVDWVLFMLALTGGVAAHAATNLFSDYSDFVKGIDTTNALSSHTGVLADELVEPAPILRAAAACSLITVLIGGFLTIIVGWPILIFGIAGLLGGFFYTGGPGAFKYAGFGEVSTGFLMGPLMVCGAYFVQTRTVSVTVILLSIAIGLLVSAVSYGNNIRDAFFDRAAGIRTMPVRMGARRALFLFRAVIILPYFFIGCATLIDARMLSALAAVLSAPWAFRIMRRLGPATDDFTVLSEQAAQNVLPLQVIRLHTRFCLFLLAGCASAFFLYR